MTILLYDHYELEERASRHLKVWKAWHLVLYALAGIFGILNYIFLQNTMQLVDNNCVLYPRLLAFRMIDLPNATTEVAPSMNLTTIYDNGSATTEHTENNKNAQNATAVHVDNLIENDDREKLKREIAKSNDTKENDGSSSVIDGVEGEEDNGLTGEDTSRLMLDTSRTLFAWESDCQFPEYMPIISAIFAAAWATMFTMCPGGGHARSGLQQPWSILAPALLFALVLVGLTGHNFTRTSGGLDAFCSAFYNVTNTTSCWAASAYVPGSWGAAWGLGGRSAAARGAAAGGWASWAGAAALLLLRCLAAPDFQLRRTTARIRDPHQKLTPYLKKSRRSQASPVSPSKRDTVSIKSEPTITTELVTASIEQDQDTAPPSLQATPVRKGHRPDFIEMKNTSFN